MPTLAPDVRRLDSELARLTNPGAALAPVAVGIEHEYRVLRGDRAIDFRALVHDLALDGRRLDPGDTNAYRCSWGGQITCDEAEAEVVTPPEPATPGFARALLAWTAAGREHLASRLDLAHTLHGFSTHLNVSTSRRAGERVCRLATRTFAPALMLVLDGPSSHGVAIRPRPGRAELCGEFADGDHLAAATVFWTGAVLAAAAAVGGDPWARAQLPPPVAANAVPDVERYGWVLYRNAFGFDLYAQGRSARFERTGGGSISAQSHLELAWDAARAALHGVASTEEIALVDGIVAGRLPLGVESPVAPAPAPGASATPVRPSGRTHARARRRPVFGEVLEPPCAGPFEAVAVVATWDHTVFRLRSTGADDRAVFACIARGNLPGFLDGLATARLTPVITRALAAAPIARVLDDWSQTATPGFYDALRATRLTAPERHPLAVPADEAALMRWVAASPPPTSVGEDADAGATSTRPHPPAGASPLSAPTRERVPDRDRPGKWRIPHEGTATGLPWWAWIVLVVLVSFGAGALLGYVTGDDGGPASTATTATPTTSAAAPTTSTATTTSTTVVTTPEITAACVFTDHFPRAADYPGLGITTPSVIVADLTVRGVAPGTELNVLISRPRILQGTGTVGADGRARVVLGISSYGRYEIAAVTLGDGTRPALGPMPSVHVVDAGEPGCT